MQHASMMYLSGVARDVDGFGSSHLNLDGRDVMAQQAIGNDGVLGALADVQRELVHLSRAADQAKHGVPGSCFSGVSLHACIPCCGFSELFGNAMGIDFGSPVYALRLTKSASKFPVGIVKTDSLCALYPAANPLQFREQAQVCLWDAAY